MDSNKNTINKAMLKNMNTGKRNPFKELKELVLEIEDIKNMTLSEEDVISTTEETGENVPVETPEVKLNRKKSEKFRELLAKKNPSLFKNNVGKHLIDKIENMTLHNEAFNSKSFERFFTKVEEKNNSINNERLTEALEKYKNEVGKADDKLTPNSKSETLKDKLTGPADNTNEE
jgi:hypothetical protein